ncbi:MAG: neutral/alkaline non-lysosomal ceramidase N-terminal domain-containing protein [Planctomycetes bacterium]|nr:neutral/alkaline non-lysosomal ceramidase N-terminal domain-containing protein [Planctomycetota bacterium]
MIFLGMALRQAPAQDADALHVGFAELDVTPKLDKKPVYMAGFGKNRVAKAIHDPLIARAMVLKHKEVKLAFVSVDVVGLFLPLVEKARAKLPGFTHVLVSSTHNHEGPDTLGLWGPNMFQSGVDPDYRQRIEDAIVAAVQTADKSARPMTAKIGTARAPELLHDSREPIVKHDELVAIEFLDNDTKTAGVVVQWNCHPETLESKNVEISADFVGATVGFLKEKYNCPVVYLTGTVGGLMTSLRVKVEDDNGNALEDGTFAKTERYGQLVGKLAVKALENAKDIKLMPLIARTRKIFLPLDNRLYVLGWELGVLDRQAFRWNDSIDKAEPVKSKRDAKGKLCLRTEIGYFKLGDLEIAAIPGEIYPELVLSKVVDPAEKEADFPDAPIEPGIYAQLKGPHRMIIGLASDEIGYILPKRQWDEKPPFCYGRKTAPYGEINSLGPDTAPLLCEAFRELVRR